MSDLSAPLAVMLAIGVSGLGLGFVALIERFVRDSTVAAAALLAVSGFLSVSDGWPDPAVVAGFTILPDDILFAALLVAALLRLLRAPSVTIPQRLLLGLVALAGWSTVRGTLIFGLGPSVNELRDFLYFVGGALFFSTTVPTRTTREQLGRYLVRLSVVLVVLVIVRWLVLGVVPHGTPFLTRSEEGGIRVVNSRDALLLAEMGLVLAPLWFRGGLSRARTWLFGALILEALLLQHRTVWLAVVGGVALLVLSNPELGRRVTQAIAVATALAAAFILVLIGNEGTALPQSPVDPNTIVWRYEGWSALITQDLGGVEELALGRPMGSGYDRQIRGYTVEVTPHNYFLQIFLRTGGAGLVLFIALFATTFRRLGRTGGSEEDLLSPQMLRILLAMIALFLVAWKPDQVQGIVLGIILATAYPNVRVPSLAHGRLAAPRPLVGSRG